MRSKDKTGKVAAPNLPWATARVCPVSRKPWDPDGYCWTCGGYHVLNAQACRTCGAKLTYYGYCEGCGPKGGGYGYKLVRTVAHACHPDCEECFADGAHIGYAPLYDRVERSVWWTKDQAREKMAELARLMGARYGSRRQG